MFKTGRIVAQNTINRTNETKRQKLLSKYQWEIAESYYDIDLNISATGTRNKIFITLRQFKKYLEEGENLISLKKKGISKHLIGFFSAFCQGKINLSQEKFVEEYNSGLSLDDISKKYKIDRGHLTFLRELFEEKKKGATFLNRKHTEIPLTQRQKNILYGSMMGDAKRNNPQWNSVVCFQHSDKQEAYLKWKFEEFKNVSKKENLKFYLSNDQREEYKGHYGSWSFYTKANSDVEECLNKFYGENGKQINRDILDNLSELSLAVWYCDDGTTGFSYKTKEKTGWNITPEVKFCTDSYSKESCENIVKWFKERWNIDAHYRNRQIRSDGEMSYRVILDSTSVYDFIDLIRPYIIPSMMYKIDYEAYKKKREQI